MLGDVPWQFSGNELEHLTTMARVRVLLNFAACF
jgi:hypothetical protein